MYRGSSGDQIDMLVKLLASSDKVRDEVSQRPRHMGPHGTLDQRTIVLGGRRFLVIYDKDGRQDIVMIEDSSLRETVARSALSVAAVFHQDSLVDVHGGVGLVAEVAANKFNLVPTTRFHDQPTAAAGTAFVVGEYHLLTAGHNIAIGNQATRRFVFGYQVDETGEARLQVPKDWVYQPEKVERVRDSTGADWALVKVDRKLDRPPLTLRRTEIKKGEQVYYIGYPRGLPIKYAGEARVLDPGAGPYFRANLDTFKGSSGSPVFDAEHRVIGIHVRGIKESEQVDGGGWTDRRVTTGEGDAVGEEVTKISAIRDDLLQEAIGALGVQA